MYIILFKLREYRVGDSMKLRKIHIVSDLAHFKKPFSTKTQETYSIPPVSTIIGIMKNLFDENINNYKVGYVFEADRNSFKDIQRIYKEINFNARSENDRYDTKSRKWVTDIAEIHYLVKPKLTIYTDIEDKMQINEPLNLGKTDCLARIVNDEWIDLQNISGEGFNQFTPLEIGNGRPMRITTETKYNGTKGYYDIFRKEVRLSNNFKYDKNYDEDLEQNIFLWKYEGEGAISEYR